MARRAAPPRRTNALKPEEIKALVDALPIYRFFPVEYCENVIGVQLDEWQRWTARGVATQARVLAGLEAPVRGMRRTAVASSTGVGKDMIAACLGLWFLTTFDNPKVIVTGPNDDQLDDVMWPEFAKWINHGPILPQIVEWQAESIVHRGNPTNAFISRRTARVRISQGGERHAEGLSGVHEDNVFIVFDESPGIEEEVWDALLPTMTGPNNVALGNPNRTSGMFFKIWYDEGESQMWRKIRVSSEAWPAEFRGAPDFISDRPGDDVKEELRRRPITDPVRLSKLYGRHPVGVAVNVIFSYEEVTEAMHRPAWPFAPEDDVQIGVDVARFGSDRTVYMVRRGYNITRIIKQGQSPSTLIKDTIKALCEDEGAITYAVKRGGDRAERIAEYHEKDQVERARSYPLIVIDMGGGYGAGVYDELVADGYENIEGAQFGGPANEDERYYNRASEMWAGTLKALMPLLSIPFDEDLRTELTTRPYDFDKTDGERLRILDKKAMKRLGLPSPDCGDSLCLSIVQPEGAGVY